jgi:hypothetical protein
MLAIPALILVLALPVLRYLLLPAYDQWKMGRENVWLLSQTLSRLNHNLSVEDEAHRQFQSLAPEAWQTESQQVTLSRFLSGMESLANTSGVTVTSAKPQVVIAEKTQNLFRVKLTAIGRLPDQLRFFSSITSGAEPTGVEGFSLRGLQGGDSVECSSTLLTVRLLGQQPKGARP